MTANVGALDRLIRFVLGIVLLAVPFVSGLPIFDATWAIVLSIVVGLVMLFTSALKFCPLYTIFGLRTCKAS